VAKKKAKITPEVDLSAVLNQLAQLTSVVQSMVEEKPVKKSPKKAVKKTPKKKVERVTSESDEEIEEVGEANLFQIHKERKRNFGRLVTKAKCKPTDDGSEKEPDLIKYPKRKKSKRPKAPKMETRKCQYCDKQLPYIEGLIEDFACAKCLTGG
jgi:hypothetical protein